jgi:sugar (pentulose or hexulose) kinase
VGSGAVDWETLEAEVDDTPETDLEVSLSFYPGACGDRGQIRNMRESNMSRGHLLRAAFKNMAENYYECASKLPNSTTQIAFSGGLAARFPSLREEILKRFGKPSRMGLDREDALFGLLMLAKSTVEGVPVGQVIRKWVL